MRTVNSVTEQHDPIVLALDTASALTAVALVSDGVLAEDAHFDPRGHAEALVPMIRRVLASAGDIRPSLVVCGVGPGPYTGLRVGIATAQALALTWSVPVIGVCSLDAVAWAALAQGVPGPVGVAMDARRREIYWATYDSSMNRVHGPRVSRANELTSHIDHSMNEQIAQLRWVGSAVATFPDHLPAEEYQPWGVEGIAGLAGALGRLAVQAVQQDLAVLEPHQSLRLSAHGSDDGATERALVGRVLLPPEPLYLRRPDAIASMGVS